MSLLKVTTKNDNELMDDTEDYLSESYVED